MNFKEWVNGGIKLTMVVFLGNSKPPSGYDLTLWLKHQVEWSKTIRKHLDHRN